MSEKIGEGKPQELFHVTPFNLRKFQHLWGKNWSIKTVAETKINKFPCLKRVSGWLCQAEFIIHRLFMWKTNYQQLSYSKLSQLLPEYSAPTFNKIPPLSVSTPNTDILEVKTKWISKMVWPSRQEIFPWTEFSFHYLQLLLSQRNGISSYL